MFTVYEHSHSLYYYYLLRNHSSLADCQTVHSTKYLLFIILHTTVTVGRDSSVGTATRYELDGPRIESRLFRVVIQSGCVVQTQH